LKKKNSQRGFGARMKKSTLKSSELRKYEKILHARPQKYGQKKDV